MPGLAAIVAKVRSAPNIPDAEALSLPAKYAFGVAITGSFVVPQMLGNAAHANALYDLEASPEGSSVTDMLSRMLTALPDDDRREIARQYMADNWDNLRNHFFALNSPDPAVSGAAVAELGRRRELNDAFGLSPKPFDGNDKLRALDVLDELGGNRLVGSDGANEVLTDQQYQLAVAELNAATSPIKSQAIMFWAAHSQNGHGLPRASSGNEDPAQQIAIAALTIAGVSDSTYMHALPAVLSKVDARLA